MYYPWRRAVVRLLGPRAFSTLRLDRNHNKLTRDEQARLRTLSIGVVGVSAGHSIAHVLAMEGLAGEIRLADFDTLELSNLNRVPASVLDLGVNKAVVAARRIAEIDPYLRVIVVPEGITPDNLVSSSTDSTSSSKSATHSTSSSSCARPPARGHPGHHGDERPGRARRRALRPRARSADLPRDPRRPGLDRPRGPLAAEKSIFVLRLLGANEASARGAASLFELGTTITGWPQLASEMTLGAVTVAAAVRRFGLSAGTALGTRAFRRRRDPHQPRTRRGLGRGRTLTPPPPVDPLPHTSDPIELIVDAARRAPSGGNAQPWRFEADEDEIRFYVVPERSANSMDVQLRGSYVAMGAAIFNARVRRRRSSGSDR